MPRLERLDNLYKYAEMPIQHFVIRDELLHRFSVKVRKLNTEMREWIDVSKDWDDALANLRRADWRLRNQPAEFSSSHPAKIQLTQGLTKLDGLYSNLGDEIRNTCRTIEENGHIILQKEESSLNSNLIGMISECLQYGANRVAVILRQDDLVLPFIQLLKNNSIHNVLVETRSSILQKKLDLDKIFVVGNSLDYSPSVFTSLFTEYGTTLIGYSWVIEQKSIGTGLSELASRPIRIKVLHSGIEEPIDEADRSHFLEPSIEIASRQLSAVAQKVYANIDKSNIEDEKVPCRAYLLAGNNVVFLPSKEGAIDSIDMQASFGNRVQRIPISSIEIGSVILLRVGKSDSDSIIDMANAIGGDQAKGFRNLQIEWKDALRARIKAVGSQVVIKELKDMGIKNPWINEWKSIKNNIRPDRDDYFEKLLRYLKIEPAETISAMNALRKLHLMAAMRLRKLLKEKFESIDLQVIYDSGFVLVDLGVTPEIAKLGAFVCLSVGEDVFDVPESEVKQLKKAVL